MPYIAQSQRKNINPNIDKLLLSMLRTPGELNYIITRLVLSYTTPLNYTRIAEVTGVLENVKQEFYRQAVAIYEDQKIEENGDVY